MKKLSLILLFLLIGLSMLAAAETVSIQNVTGKVEINSGTGWRPAARGASIDLGTVISTGFGARAVLQVGLSTVEVRPLTRMTVSEYVESQGSVNTSLDLKVGKVRAQVRSAEGTSHNFSIKSTTSTASVRGTELFFDGFSVDVFEGTVSFQMNDSGTRELVFEGESSGGERVLISSTETEVIPPVGGEIPSTITGAVPTGTLVVTFK
ncbi:MAG: FecR domain-containing protein [Spirochaetota bacterium]